MENEEKDEWLYYARYDVAIRVSDGLIHLPICSCGDEDGCIFMQNWTEDGKPTHLEEQELAAIVNRYKE